MIRTLTFLLLRDDLYDGLISQAQFEERCHLAGIDQEKVAEVVSELKLMDGVSADA